MKLLCLLVLCCAGLVLSVPSVKAAEWPDGVIGGLQHAGAVHFYAQRGMLNITLYKRDSAVATLADRTMKAFLYGPDGTVHDSAVLPGQETTKEKSGPMQQEQLQANIEHAGVYTLLVTMNQDQYVRLVSWGFASNAAQFVINANTGHADRRRNETIMLYGEMKPFGIFFKPPQRKFNVEISRLPATVQQVEMFDASGKLLKAMPLQKGEAKSTFDGTAAGENDIWELRLPVQRGSILMDGFNQNWEKGETILPVWSTSRAHYFDLADYHWLLEPRRFARQVKAGDAGVVEVEIYNHSKQPMPINVSAENVPARVSVEMTPAKVLLAPGATQKVQVRYALPENLPNGNYDFHVVAANAQAQRQAFSLIELRVGKPPQTNVSLPIQLQLYGHDQFQFAYEPDYPRETQFYFDSDNRPWTLTGDGLKVLLNGQWKTIELPGGKTAEDNYPGARFGNPASALGTDQNGYVYTIVNRGNQPHLLRVSCKDLTPQLAALPAGGNYMIEAYMGGKASSYPPAVLHYKVNSTENTSFWARRQLMEMYLPQIKDGKLTISDAIPITDNCVGMSAHSGIVSAVAADGDLLHLVWGATSDPEKKDPGVPTYIATYNRKTGKLSAPLLLTYAPPVNDVHNMSTILVDSKGGRHVIIGAHGKSFQYLYCKPGEDAWSKPQNMSHLGQTYVGAVLDDKDRIDLFCRTWQQGKEFPGRFNAALYYQQMDANNQWKAARPFAEVPLPGYAVFYHRVTVDRTGRVYVSFAYWSTWAAYRESFRDASSRRTSGADRLFLSSADGENWNLVTTAEMEKHVQR